MAAQEKGILGRLFDGIFGGKKITPKELSEKLRKSVYQIKQAMGKMDHQMRKLKPRFDAAVNEGVKAAGRSDAIAMQSAGLKLRMAAFLTSKMQGHRGKLLRTQTWCEGKLGDLEAAEIMRPVADVVAGITDNKEMQEMLMDVATETDAMMEDVTRDLDISMASAEEPGVGDFELEPLMGLFRQMATAVKSGDQKKVTELKAGLPGVITNGLQVEDDSFGI